MLALAEISLSHFLRVGTARLGARARVGGRYAWELSGAVNGRFVMSLYPNEPLFSLSDRPADAAIRWNISALSELTALCGGGKPLSQAAREGRLAVIGGKPFVKKLAWFFRLVADPNSGKPLVDRRI